MRPKETNKQKNKLHIVMEKLCTHFCWDPHKEKRSLAQNKQTPKKTYPRKRNSSSHSNTAQNHQQSFHFDWFWKISTFRSRCLLLRYESTHRQREDNPFSPQKNLLNRTYSYITFQQAHPRSYFVDNPQSPVPLYTTLHATIYRVCPAKYWYTKQNTSRSWRLSLRPI